jgi:hypothetical protein
LTVTYSIGGGIKENVVANSITAIDEIIYLNTNATVDLDSTKTSIAINNPEAARGGKAKEDLESIRQNAIASFAAQNRAITREDYIARCYAMPARYGGVAKVYIQQDMQQDVTDIDYPRETVSNPLALNLYVLGYDVNGNFVATNKALRENLRTYLSQFRMLTDAINIKAAHVVNIKVYFEVIPKNFENGNEVILRCIEKLKQVLHNDRMQINGSISISELIAQLDAVSGVQSIPTLQIENIKDSGYSNVEYDLAAATKNNTIYPSLDPCIFEIKYPSQDIRGRVIKP